MAHHLSAKKRIRQSEKRKVHNKYYARTTRNAIKTLRSMKSKEEAVTAFNAGAQHLTLPFNILTSLLDDPLSIQAVEQFNQFQTHL